MAEFVMADYLAMLERSRLFESRAQLDECFEKWQSSDGAADAEDTHAFADWLIAGGYITQWQSDNIFQGKYKGFFLGKYKLLRSIGAGGMSSVYLAVHTILERQVAIKVLPKSRVTSDSSYLERFLLEAQAVAALDHPNIVRAYDVDTEGNSIYYLVMEYIDGKDLLSIVKQDGPMDIYRAAKFIRQAAGGLHHAHLAGLIHRDMKPANLLVDAEDNVHVLDLGLARFTDQNRSSLTLTYDENVLGTADYLAPEQARNSHTVDARADIYGLGCTLYYLLVGHVPFPEGTLAQRIAAHQKRMPARIQDERPEVPDELAEICWKMMAKDPNDRQQSAEEVSDDLTYWLLSNGQKVDGFTGSLAALERKKNENAQRKDGEIKSDAQKELESLGAIANLAMQNTESTSRFPLSSSRSVSKAPALKNQKETKSKELGQGLIGMLQRVQDQLKGIVPQNTKPAKGIRKAESGSQAAGFPNLPGQSGTAQSASGIGNAKKTSADQITFGGSAVNLEAIVQGSSQGRHASLSKTSKAASASSRSGARSGSSIQKMDLLKASDQTEEKADSRTDSTIPGFMDFLNSSSSDSAANQSAASKSQALRKAASKSGTRKTTAETDSQISFNFNSLTGSSKSSSGTAAARSSSTINFQIPQSGSTVAKMRKTGAADSETSAAHQNTSVGKKNTSKKKNDQKLSAIIALIFFLILLVLAFFAFST